MKASLAVFLTFLFVATGTLVSRAQEPNDASDSSAYRAALKTELSQYAHGAELYRDCDAFGRAIDLKVRQRLAKAKPSQKEPFDIFADTFFVSDAVNRDTVDQDEPSVAINKLKPKLIVAGANDDNMGTRSMPAYLSTNSGQTWRTYRLPMIQDGSSMSWGDPILISDLKGNFYYAFLIFDPNNPFDDISDIMVAHSSDGIHWTLGTPVLDKTTVDGLLEDKETLTVDNDPNSPYYGRLYVAWTEYDANDDMTNYLAFSDDMGETWSVPNVYTTTYGYFGLARAGTDGTLFIGSSANGLLTGTNEHGMTVSNDGGETFSEHAIASYTDFPLLDQYHGGLKGEFGFRSFPYISYDVDAQNGIDLVFGSYDTVNSAALYFTVRSTDEGATWGTPVPIGSSGLLFRDHFMPWVARDQSLATTYISLYSSEDDSLNLNSRAVRCNFQTPNQMQQLGLLFDPLYSAGIGGEPFIGDYVWCDAWNGTFVAVWTQNRPGNNFDGDIFAYTTSPLSSGVTSYAAASTIDAEITPNPATGRSITCSIQASAAMPATVRMFNLRGTPVGVFARMIDPASPNELSIDIHSFPAGVYHAVIESDGQSIDRNFVVLR